jgi:hypothetical protein
MAGSVMFRRWIVVVAFVALSGCATHSYRCNDRLRPINAAPVSTPGPTVPEAPK